MQHAWTAAGSPVGLYRPRRPRHDPDATQDWYLCSSRNFMLTSPLGSIPAALKPSRGFFSRNDYLMRGSCRFHVVQGSALSLFQHQGVAFSLVLRQY